MTISTVPLPSSSIGHQTSNEGMTQSIKPIAPLKARRRLSATAATIRSSTKRSSSGTNLVAMDGSPVAVTSGSGTPKLVGRRLVIAKGSRRPTDNANIGSAMIDSATFAKVAARHSDWSVDRVAKAAKQSQRAKASVAAKRGFEAWAAARSGDAATTGTATTVSPSSSPVFIPSPAPTWTATVSTVPALVRVPSPSVETTAATSTSTSTSSAGTWKRRTSSNGSPLLRSIIRRSPPPPGFEELHLTTATKHSAFPATPPTSPTATYNVAKIAQHTDFEIPNEAPLVVLPTLQTLEVLPAHTTEAEVEAASAVGSTLIAVARTPSIRTVIIAILTIVSLVSLMVVSSGSSIVDIFGLSAAILFVTSFAAAIVLGEQYQFLQPSPPFHATANSQSTESKSAMAATTFSSAKPRKASLKRSKIVCNGSGGLLPMPIH